MRIVLENLSSARVSLSLPDDEGLPSTVELELVRGLCGVIERTVERLAFTGVSAEQMIISGVDWRVSGAHVVSGRPVELTEIILDARFFTTGGGRWVPAGRVACSNLDAGRLSLGLAGHRLTAGLVGRGLEWVSDDQGQGWRAQLAELRATTVQTVLAGLVVRVASVLATEARLTVAHSDRAAFDRQTSALAGLVATNLEADGRGLQFTCAELALPGGLQLSTEGVSIPLVTVTDVTVGSADVASLLAGFSRDDAPALDLFALFDVTQLDRLSGAVHVDVTVDANLPVLGNRVATHEFRVSISDGVFNYRQLERGLSALEDSIIDFETRAGMLILERDVPLVGMRKDLIRWQLPTEQDRFLARSKSVRIRTLLRPEIVRDEDQASTDVSVRRVSVDNLAVDLSATRNDGSPICADGALTDLELSGMHLTGHIHLFIDRPGVINLTLESLSLRIRALELGDVRIDHARVLLTGVRVCQLAFEGNTPRALQLSVAGIRLEDVQLTRVVGKRVPPQESL